MAVRSLDKNKDWNFGKGKADFLTKSDEVAQNVQTRLKSFKRDWFLDTDANIDWINILGSRKNENIIIREVTRVTKETAGVKTVLSVVVDSLVNRDASITVKYEDIYNNTFIEAIGVTNG